jgi:hypothetical protein
VVAVLEREADYGSSVTRFSMTALWKDDEPLASTPRLHEQLRDALLHLRACS